MNLILRQSILCAIVVIAALAATGCPPQWQRLFNGFSLKGWFISDQFSQGDTQSWFVERGAIVGEQDTSGNGGILLTEKLYGDFHIELEVNPDTGMDTGLFLRSTEAGECYQVTIDLQENGRVGAIFGEQLGTGFLSPIPENWDELYNQDEWNRIAAQITGNPPHITVWINDVRVVDWKDDTLRLPSEGHIGLQVHGGDQYFGLQTRARKIRIIPLD